MIFQLLSLAGCLISTTHAGESEVALPTTTAAACCPVESRQQLDENALSVFWYKPQGTRAVYINTEDFAQDSKALQQRTRKTRWLFIRVARRTIIPSELTQQAPK